MALLRYCANAELCLMLLALLMDKASIAVAALLLRIQPWLATRIKPILILLRSLSDCTNAKLCLALPALLISKASIAVATQIKPILLQFKVCVISPRCLLDFSSDWKPIK